jgi:hypothetical protein
MVYNILRKRNEELNMTANEKKVTELLEELEKEGYVIEEIGDKFSPGYFIYDGNLIVAEIYNSGTYIVSDKAADGLLDFIANKFKKVVDK